MAFLSAAHISIGEATKSVKTLGPRDWLLVMQSLFGMALVAYVLWGLGGKIDAHAVSAAPAIESVQKLEDLYRKSVELDERAEARMSFLVCTILAGDSKAERKVCVDEDTARRIREGRQ